MSRHNLTTTGDEFAPAARARGSLPGVKRTDLQSIFAPDAKHDDYPMWFDEIGRIAALADVYQDCENDKERLGVCSDIRLIAQAFPLEI